MHFGLQRHCKLFANRIRTGNEPSRSGSCVGRHVINICHLFNINKSNLRSQDGVVLQRKVIITDPWWLSFPAGTSTLIRSGQVRVATQLSGGTVGKVQVPERGLGVEVDIGQAVLQQATGRAEWCGP